MHALPQDKNVKQLELGGDRSTSEELRQPKLKSPPQTRLWALHHLLILGIRYWFPSRYPWSKLRRRCTLDRLRWISCSTLTRKKSKLNASSECQKLPPWNWFLQHLPHFRLTRHGGAQHNSWSNRSELFRSFRRLLFSGVISHALEYCRPSLLVR